MESWDETNVTDIEIAADGRLHIFGASQEIMTLLQSLGWQDDRLGRCKNRQNVSPVAADEHQPIVVTAYNAGQESE